MNGEASGFAHRPPHTGVSLALVFYLVEGSIGPRQQHFRLAPLIGCHGQAHTAAHVQPLVRRRCGVRGKLRQ